MAQAHDVTTEESQAYLPDFCAPGSVLVVLLLAALISIVLTLAAHTPPGTFLTELAEMSLYVFWLALLSCLVLCRARPWVERSGKTRAFVVCFLLLEGLCLILAEIAYLVAERFGDTLLINDSHPGFLLRNFAISSIVIALAMRYLYVSSEWRRSVVLEAQARIRALQALIRPHFLFNSMNTIASLVRTSPERAEQAVEDLSDLLRANLRSTRSRTTLAQEFDTARIYERIEKLRLGERLKIDWRTSALPDSALIPSLTIQPLLENAIFHGIEQLPDGGTITIDGRRDGDYLHIDIRNPRCLADSRRHGHGMALSNVRQRFELAYHGHASVDVRGDDEHYHVCLTFPFEEWPA